MEVQLKIGGMSCGGCVASVERAVRALTGVGEVKVDLAQALARVVFDPDLTNAAAIRAAIEGAGYDIED
ncbi:heavy-metal-associated domain-containing protein [Chitinimonas sp. BJYL2]|uniref:heavy-metal-associated domain-containing protein n=1 Tax=Chitinimonas sp. BJYL2 TaxID=2976696 RepID=UPI0022B395EF|nr:heavy-metal-associated domain-containing protein [Chitinimonas sp. BJYL2]